MSVVRSGRACLSLVAVRHPAVSSQLTTSFLCCLLPLLCITAVNYARIRLVISISIVYDQDDGQWLLLMMSRWLLKGSAAIGLATLPVAVLLKTQKRTNIREEEVLAAEARLPSLETGGICHGVETCTCRPSRFSDPHW